MKLRAHDPPYQVISTSIGPLAYTDFGVGTPVVALHGAPGSVRDFRYLAGSLDGAVRLIALDYPGFGESAATAEDDGRAESCVEAALALLDALRIKKAIFVGHSLGGHIAQRIAIHSPERVLGLCLLASLGLRPHRTLRATPFPALNWLLDSPFARWILPSVRKGFVKSGFSPNLSDDLLKRTVRLLAHIDYLPVNSQLGCIPGPCLVAWAADDALIEPEVSEELAQAMPQGPRLHFESGGHYISKYQADEIARELVQMATW